MRRCANCRNPIPAEARADARYCGAKCRKSAYSEAIWEADAPPALSPELAELRDTLIAHSQPFMVGYSLGLIDRQPGSTRPTVWLPPTQGRSKRYDGTFDDRPYFELRPRFEIPRVPAVGMYHLEFVCDNFKRVEAPYALSGGIYIPVASEMCLPGKKNIRRRRPQRKY